MFLTRSGILIPPINNRRSKDKTFRTKILILKPPIPDRRFKDSHFQFSGLDAPKRTTVLRIEQIGTSGCSWQLLAHPGCSWRLLAAPGDSWLAALLASGCSWWLLAVSGGPWQLLAAPGCLPGCALAAGPGRPWWLLVAPWRYLAAPRALVAAGGSCLLLAASHCCDGARWCQTHPLTLPLSPGTSWMGRTPGASAEADPHAKRKPRIVGCLGRGERPAPRQRRSHTQSTNPSNK